MSWSLSFHPEESLWRLNRVNISACCFFLTSKQHASSSQGRICSDKRTRRHTEIEAAHQTFYLTQSPYTDTGPTSNPAPKIATVEMSSSSLQDLSFSRRAHSVCLLVACLHNVPATCQCISGTDLLRCTCCHTEIEVADQNSYPTQPQYTDTGPTSPGADPTTPGAW